MKKQTKHLLIGTGVVAVASAAFLSVSFLTAKKLVTIALDRAAPKHVPHKKRNVYGYSKTKEMQTLQEAAGEQLSDSGCETIEIVAHDGEKLIGHLHICENAKRTILAMHGWRSSWLNDFGLISSFWHKNRCNVLYVEQRGQGNSGGKYMGFGLIERFDCLDWINWLNTNGYERLPIYLCGISMGATSVLMAGGLELPQNVHGICADCGFTSPYAIWRHVAANNLRIAYPDLLGQVADDLCKRKINIGAKAYSCLDAMKVCKVPVLFVHGTDDHFVPIEMTFENYKACVSPKRLLVVPGAEHGKSYFVEKEEYERTVLEFWNTWD